MIHLREYAFAYHTSGQLQPSPSYKPTHYIAAIPKYKNCLQSVNISQTPTLKNSIWTLFTGLPTQPNKNINPLLPPHGPRPAKRFDTEPKFEVIK